MIPCATTSWHHQFGLKSMKIVLLRSVMVGDNLPWPIHLQPVMEFKILRTGSLLYRSCKQQFQCWDLKF